MQHAIAARRAEGLHRPAGRGRSPKGVDDNEPPLPRQRISRGRASASSGGWTICRPADLQLTDRPRPRARGSTSKPRARRSLAAEIKPALDRPRHARLRLPVEPPQGVLPTGASCAWPCRHLIQQCAAARASSPEAPDVHVRARACERDDLETRLTVHRYGGPGIDGARAAKRAFELFEAVGRPQSRPSGDVTRESTGRRAGPRAPHRAKPTAATRASRATPTAARASWSRCQTPLTRRSRARPSRTRKSTRSLPPGLARPCAAVERARHACRRRRVARPGPIP